MARGYAPLWLLACVLLLSALRSVAAEREKQSQHVPNNEGQEPLMMRLFQNAEYDGVTRSHTRSEDGRYQSTTYNPTHPQASHHTLTCSSQCPLCPKCPSQDSCSPCPSVPQCQRPQACPNPCAACPECPTCKRPIPPGYEYFPKLGYYRLHTVPVTWMEAKATCEREGAHLAIINSQEEADLMKNLFHRDLDIGSWIYLGFHDLYREGKYVTLFGKPLADTGYTTWNPGQPDNHNNDEHCGSMFQSGGLNDLQCLNRQPFVCELPV